MKLKSIYENISKYITVYHGTDKGRAAKIASEKMIKGYFGWGPGVCTNISRARNFTIYATQRYAKEHHIKFSTEILYDAGRIIILQLNKKFMKTWVKEGGANDAFTLEDENHNKVELNLNDKNQVGKWKIITMMESEKYLKNND